MVQSQEPGFEAEYLIFTKLQGNRCSMFNDLKMGFSILESEPTESNFKDFQTLIKEITKLFSSISNDVKEISLGQADQQKMIDSIQSLEKTKLEKTVKMMQLKVQTAFGEIDHSEEVEELGKEIQDLELKITNQMQDLRIEIYG